MIRAFLATVNRSLETTLARLSETRLARLDTDISSRMAASSYTAQRAAKLDRIDTGPLSGVWSDP